MIKSRILYLAIGLFIATSFCNAQKIIMKVSGTTGVNGEEVRALEFGIESPTNFLSGSGVSVGKAVPGSLKVKKNNDKSTSNLFKNLIKGVHFQEVSFEYYDGSNVLYYVITLSTAFVNKILWLSPECPTCLKLEHQVEFVFAKMKTEDKINNITLTWDVEKQTIL